MESYFAYVIDIALDKDNQDAFSVLPHFGHQRAFFGVYDGHGKDGHLCARFARDHVSKL